MARRAPLSPSEPVQERQPLRPVASASPVARFFRDDAHLQQLYLRNVTPTGEYLGVGSYGSVMEVIQLRSEIIQLQCIIH